MACNAHNHSLLCDCGWGGTNNDPWQPALKVDWSQAKSHTIPNARCPICSASVFFYRSPNGGSVFFDNLGPPWPKHPCTRDGAHCHTEKIFEERNKKAKQKNKKHKKTRLWWAFPCSKIEELPEKKVFCLYGKNNKHLYIKSKSIKMSPHTPIWIRPILGKPGQYHASTFHLVGDTVREFCYTAYVKND